MLAARAEQAIGAAERAQLVGFLQRRCGNATLAEDIAQDAIVRLVDFARREKVEKPLALLARIATNLLINHQRREARLIAGLIDDPVDDRPCQERSTVDADRLDQLRRAIDTLPPLRREVLIRRRLEGQSYREIGTALNLSSAAVEKHVVRALADLRAYQERHKIEGDTPW
ncbi:RNA polymerase sigma factor [Sphingomonas sp. R1]|uniref:RNA polymerase sigma factor n=1 Tax=Sphingomonas sp. R1 TaxID=399176 RepID=UPI002224F858|nr:RNA polymerase sigma factor [Sphingomonas sp. R1]UYY77535.1 RNA polymerase sigma factor [Sphingomonas sp. R1]